MSHIKTESDDDKSWCGVALGNEFYFKNAEYAAIGGIRERKPSVCNRCIEEVIACLQNVKKYEYEE